MQVLLQPAKRTSHDKLVKLKDLLIGSPDPSHVILCRRLAVYLGDAGLIADIRALDGRLSHLLQYFVVCPCAKEVFWDQLANYVKKVGGQKRKRVSLTALDALFQPKELQTLGAERTTDKIPP